MQYPRSICNIHMKHLKHKSELLETQRRRRPHPTWRGTPVASKLGSGGHREQQSIVHPRRSAKASHSYRLGHWMGLQAQVSPASPSTTGKVDGGMARGVEQCGHVAGAAAERKAARRRGRVRSRSSRNAAAIFFKKLWCLMGSEYKSG
jgi:hypothetical protein